MEIKYGTIGFCSGVKRAVELAKDVKNGELVYTLGPLVHNKLVVNELQGLGIEIKKLENVLKNDVIIITAHGVSSNVYEQLQEKQARIIDTTCQVVKELQDKADEIKTWLKYDGKMVIFGDENHIEVENIVKNTGALIAPSNNYNLCYILKQTSKIGILAQTTQDYKAFKDFIDTLTAKFNGAEIKVHDTLCKEVTARQKEAEHLREFCGVILVVGDKTSANTKRLYEIASKCTNSYHIETVEDPILEQIVCDILPALKCGASDVSATK